MVDVVIVSTSDWKLYVLPSDNKIVSQCIFHRASMSDFKSCA